MHNAIFVSVVIVAVGCMCGVNLPCFCVQSPPSQRCVPMANFLSEYLLDPSVVFMTIILVVPLTKTDSNVERLAYASDPWVLGAVAITVLAALYVRGLPSLPSRDRMAARWYIGRNHFVNFVLV